jgi:hypothetical protein
VAGDDEEMQRFVPIEDLFKGRHFDRQIIVLCVSWYTSFKLSLRDLVIMMADRAPTGSFATIKPMGLIRKVVPGVLAVWIALRPAQEAREAAEPVHSRAPEPPHNHPELHEPAFAMESETGVAGGGSQSGREVRVADNIHTSEELGLQILEPVFGTLWAHLAAQPLVSRQSRFGYVSCGPSPSTPFV